MSEINGDLIVIKVRPNSTAGQTTFRQIICTGTVSLNTTNDITKRKTSCGTKSSVSDVDFNLSGSGVFDTTQTSSQCSWDDLEGWQKSKTKLDFMFLNLAQTSPVVAEGDGVSEVGSCYVTDVTFTGDSEDGTATFDFTLEGTGTLGSYDI